MGAFVARYSDAKGRYIKLRVKINNFIMKKEQKITKETSGMKKLVKKVLTDKATRNAATMSAFVATVASVGYPWNLG